MISNRIKPAEITAKVQLMCNALKHGGPDDEGIFTDEIAGLSFGHRRLSIIDLSKNGHQPMADSNGKVWITFNGEIYNYPELKAQLLGTGAKFCSNTDTEVILAAYLQWGEKAFAKLRGMFAFALYDVARALTYLVRDTAGIKPLYYHIQNGQLSFASEVKAFEQADIASEIDTSWQVRLLAFGHIPEPFTTLKNVFSLQKGHFLLWNHHNYTYQINKYEVEKSNVSFINDPGLAREKIHDGLKAAVKRQLIADASIGVFLSGGVDSSLLTLLANQEKKQQLKTISIYFNEKNYDERKYQSVVLNQVQGEKFAHLVQQKDFEEHFPHILGDMDMPTTDGINTWFISKYAHDDGLKAVLSGLGADELFGGYPSFKRIKYLRYLRKIPSPVYSVARYFKADRFKKISFLSYNHTLADYLLLRGIYIPGDIAKILDSDTRQINDILFNTQQVPKMKSYDGKHAAWFETNLYMQNQLLRDTDVMSMSHGLEVRVPFLDEDLLNLIENISSGVLFNKDQPKKILIDCFKDILPNETWNRPKMGFSFPLQEWMGNHEQVSNEDFYRGKAAKSIIKRFKNGQMHWSKVFALYLIQTHG